MGETELLGVQVIQDDQLFGTWKILEQKRLDRLFKQACTPISPAEAAYADRLDACVQYAHRLTGVLIVVHRALQHYG